MTQTSLPLSIRISQWSTIACHLSLLILIMVWHAWLQPSNHLPASLMLLILALPLVAPLRGLLHGKLYTYGWCSMLYLLYFTHGVMEWWSSTDSITYWLAAAETVLSVALFVLVVSVIQLHKRQPN